MKIDSTTPSAVSLSKTRQQRPAGPGPAAGASGETGAALSLSALQASEPAGAPIDSQRVAEIRQVVKAMNIAEPLAQALNVSAGMAGLEIVRQYFDAAGQIFEVSVTVHPSDRFAVAMRLQRSEA